MIVRYGWMRGMVAVGAMMAFAACDSSTDPDLRPTRADITVTGSTTVPLRLVVSTDFDEFFDPVTGERGQSFNTADTLTLTTLPYQNTVDVSALGKVVVDLSNPSDVEATVRLRVEMDSGQDPYDREAIMSQGGALRFVFSFFSPTL
jgi:hypothetical protein